jgi:DtxR family transcriptional regulator, Mn-dependent transcriptional regulator
MTKSEEDYIKFLYQPSSHQDQEGVKISTIAKYFGYTEQSVNEMIKRLNEKNFVEYFPYKGVRLTQEGRGLALKMIRAHRIWEVFLFEKLGYGWDEVHALSEVLEHTNQDEMIEKLYHFLEKPKHCPHGNSIPTIGQEDLTDTWTSLDQAILNQPFVVQRVEDSPELLQFLTSIRIQLGTTLVVQHVDSFNELITIKVNDSSRSISFKNASKVFGNPK